MVLLESPSNPMLDVIDLRAVCALAHAAGALVVVDNVFATPLLQRPLELGRGHRGLFLHEAHGRPGSRPGRCRAGAQAWIEATLQPFIRNTGPSLAPFNAWVLLKSLDTLGPACRGGMQTCAKRRGLHWRQTRRSGGCCIRPGRITRSTPWQCADVGGRYGRHVRTCRRQAAAFAFMNALRLIAISNNLGDTKSLATHPATTTHMRIGPEERHRLGISDGVIRLSVGLEDPSDLCADLARGFDGVGTAGPRAAGGRVMGDGYTETTRNIEVTVQPFFLEDQSDPEDSRFVWAYRVRIRNKGRKQCNCSAASGGSPTDEVKSSKSKGPVSLVNSQSSKQERFRIHVRNAAQHADRIHAGSYRMVATATGETFDIAIPAFSLDSPHARSCSLAVRLGQAPRAARPDVERQCEKVSRVQWCESQARPMPRRPFAPCSSGPATIPTREGLRDTPARVARSYRELFSGYVSTPPRCWSVPSKRWRATTRSSCCVTSGWKATASITWCRSSAVLTSPICREAASSGSASWPAWWTHSASACRSRRKLTVQIADTINDVLRPKGVAVVIEAGHQCMTTRGVHKPGVSMVTSRMLGVFRTNHETRREVMALIGQRAPLENGG